MKNALGLYAKGVSIILFGSRGQRMTICRNSLGKNEKHPHFTIDSAGRSGYNDGLLKCYKKQNYI